MCSTVAAGSARSRSAVWPPPGPRRFPRVGTDWT
jgi:hypothetical protein